MPAIHGSRSRKSVTTTSWRATHKADPFITVEANESPEAKAPGLSIAVHHIAALWNFFDLLVEVAYERAATEVTHETVRLACRARNPAQRDCDHHSGNEGFCHQ